MKKRLLIIKPDHIGDYILFRNFLKVIKNSKKYKDYHLSVLFNERVESLSRYLDKEVVDEFIFMNLSKYIKGNWYYKRFNNEILLNKYNVIINFMFARFNPLEKLIDEIYSNKKIVVKDKIRVTYSEVDDKIYNDSVILTNDDFEFFRFKEGIEKIIDEKIDLDRPYLTVNEEDDNGFVINGDYIVIFIGADNDLRKYARNKYLEIVLFILANYSLDIYLCGGGEEVEDAAFIEDRTNSSRVYNLVGETSIFDMLHVSNNCTAMISNETGIAHISTILNKPTLVISNANHLAKFTPYPKEFSNYSAVYPFSLNEVNFDIHKKKYYHKGSSLDINKIETKEVILKLKKILNHKYKSTDKNFIINDTLKYTSFTHGQLKTNFTFSQIFSNIFSNVTELKNENSSFLIYGDGTFGNMVKLILGNQVIACVDKKSSLEYKKSEKIESKLVYNTKSINRFSFDKIIISVLGREEEILDYLLSTYNIPASKIVIFKVIQPSRYVSC